MMPSIPARTFFIATCLVLGLVFVPRLGSLLQFSRAPAEVSEEPPVVRVLPEVAMVEPQKAELPVSPKPVVEPAIPEPIQHQSVPTPPEARATAVSRARDSAPQSTAEPPERKEEEVVLEKPAIEEKKEVKKPEQAKAPARREPPTEKQIYSKLVALGMSLQRDGIKSPGYKAKIRPEVIKSLNRNGLIRLAVTDGKSTFLFSGTLQQPGKADIAFESDFKGLSTRYMQLDRGDGRKLLQVARDKFPGRAAHCQPVIFVRSDIDSMVLGAQNHAVISNGMTLDDVKLTSGSFRLYKGMPFNYLIDEITNSKGKRIPVGGGKGARKKR